MWGIKISPHNNPILPTSQRTWENCVSFWALVKESTLGFAQRGQDTRGLTRTHTLWGTVGEKMEDLESHNRWFLNWKNFHIKEIQESYSVLFQEKFSKILAVQMQSVMMLDLSVKVWKISIFYKQKTELLEGRDRTLYAEYTPFLTSVQCLVASQSKLGKGKNKKQEFKQRLGILVWVAVTKTYYTVG